MKLKVDDGGHVVVSDGKPVYVADDGKEIVFDYSATLATITRLNGEAKSHRTAKETAETRLAAFDGIEDPAAAKKALGIVKNLDDKKLVDAGQIETVRQEAIAAVEAKYKPVIEERDRLKGDLDSELIGGFFSRSKFITDKVAIPSDLMQARFGRNFEVKDRRPVAKDNNGNPIYSRARPGELAEPDEALEILVDQYPQKDHILKGTGNQGDAARQANGGGGSNSKTIKRAAFEQLSQAERTAKIKEGVVPVDN